MSIFLIGLTSEKDWHSLRGQRRSKLHFPLRFLSKQSNNYNHYLYFSEPIWLDDKVVYIYVYIYIYIHTYIHHVCSLDVMFVVKVEYSSVNSSPPNAAYVRQWIGSALVHLMACRLLQCWFIVSWTLWNQLQWNLIKIQTISFTKMHLKISSA